MRSLYTAVSGIKSNQMKMDVIANNIANVNTVAFKGSRLNFSEMMVQTTKSASSSTIDGLGGTNAIGVGLGVQVASMNTMTAQGALQNSGRALDAAIQGEGYFVVTDGSNTYYTRNGNFMVAGDGSLVTSDGYRVLGRLADETGVVGSIHPLEPIKVPLGQSTAPNSTTQIAVGNNLDASAAAGTKAAATLKIYDAAGVGYQVSVDFIKTTTAGEWEVKFSFDESTDIMQNWLNDNYPDYDTLSKEEKEAAIEEGNDELLGGTLVRTSKVYFDEKGKLDEDKTRNANGVNEPLLVKSVSFEAIGGSEVNLDIDISQVTQYSGASNVVSRGQDGNPMATLQSVTFTDKGEVLGVFSSGYTKVLGAIITATFSNAEGLENQGGGYFSESMNTGGVLYSKVGENGHGTLAVGCLELSNVDLSEQLTDMIVTQRAYQMNSKTMLTVDEMLQELMTIKR